MKPFFAQIERDLLIAWQNRQDLGVMLVFFVIIIALFPLAIGANASADYSLKMFAMAGFIRLPLASLGWAGMRSPRPFRIGLPPDYRF